MVGRIRQASDDADHHEARRAVTQTTHVAAIRGTWRRFARILPSLSGDGVRDVSEEQSLGCLQHAFEARCSSARLRML